MNKLTIIGNLTKAPETRTTPNGATVCSFTVAVNNPHKKDEEAQFFRVSAWNKLGEICSKYLDKGRKACVVGSVRLSTYTRQDGQNGASLEVTAEDVEFLSAGTTGGTAPKETPENDGYTDVTPLVPDDDLPF